MTTEERSSAHAGWRRGLVRAALALVALGALGAAGACNRAHMTSYYGQSYEAWFSAQHIRNEPADGDVTKRALGTLDAQEASAISRSYRRTFGGQSGDSQGQGQMVMIGQARGGNEPYVPPPSVPNAQ